MLENESTAAARRIPLDLDDGAGSEYTGTAPSGSEVLISIQGGAFATAAGVVTKLRTGDFYYEATQAETRGRGMRLLRLAKSGMGTAIFEFYCGDRMASDPMDEARRIPVMLELSGTPVTGVPVSGSEIEVSNNGGAFTTGAGSAAEIGYGAYYYQPTATEYVRGYSLINVNNAAADEYKYELEVGAANSPAPRGTTAEDIRARIATVITALTPTSLTGDKFRESRYESGDEFVSDCEANPAGAVRRFHVIETGEDEPPETSSVTEEERRSTFVVTVAYPKTARYGADQSVDRYEVMRQDQRIIERAIGMHGKANFTSPHPDATWLIDGSGTDRLTGDDQACDYLVITQRMLFLIEW